MSVPNFDRAYAFVRKMEGGDHHPTPADPNPTRWGVTQKAYDQFRKGIGQPPESVFDMDEGECRPVYEWFWEDSKAPQLPSDNLALCHFDMYFNSPPVAANKCLQRAVGILADGILGTKTLDVVRGALMQDGERALLIRMTGLRMRRYRQLVETYPHLAPNLPGWAARVTRLQKELGIG